MEEPEFHGWLNLTGVVQGFGEGGLRAVLIVRVEVIESVLPDPLFG
jgi:hypothetical protein